MKKLFKKLVKSYLECRKNEDNSQELYQYIEKTLNYYKKLKVSIQPHDYNESTGLYSTNLIQCKALKDDIELDKENMILITEIKNYCVDKLYQLFELNLVNNKKCINMDIFNPIEKGDLNAISMSESYSNYNVFNDEGSTPLHLCIKNGDATILKEFLKNGAKIDLNNKNGNTLLEYACQLKDPNLISFLVNHGSNPKKHIFFRDDNKDCKMSNNDIDLANIVKIILKSGAEKIADDVNPTGSNESIGFYSRLNDICFENIEKDKLIGMGSLNFQQFYPFLEAFFKQFSDTIQNTIIDILTEEFSYDLKNKLGCPSDTFEILIINLYPFIDYPFNFQSQSIVINELIYSIKYIFEKNDYKIDKTFNKKLINKLWLDYNQPIKELENGELETTLPFDFIGINISFILSKIKNVLIKKEKKKVNHNK